MRARSEASAHDVTGLLWAWKDGDEQALDQLTPLVYSELRRLARRYTTGERAGAGLQTTELVHEAYLRLAALRRMDWNDRAHFFAVAARFMRRILVDFARAHHRQKRNGGTPQVPLDEVLEQGAAISNDPPAALAALDDTLEALSRFDARKGQVVELRFFGGLTMEETAEVLRVSAETVRRDWHLAKAWIYREMTGAEAAGRPAGRHLTASFKPQPAWQTARGSRSETGRHR
jgi:RNA polymerase sigma factor (TIGR02999 family)